MKFIDEFTLVEQIRYICARRVKRILVVTHSAARSSNAFSVWMPKPCSQR